ncbi:hypothetical protein [Sphingomonas sp.]|uniref:hypothetical protein n=1 Tax=Sphingomonas sp. TaxID=28214 RepID=UPI0035C7DF8F
MTATALAFAHPADPYATAPDPARLRVAALAPPAELERAATLLLLGAHRLGQLATDGALAAPWPTGSAAGVRARYVANCLRELDTFLKGLLDQVAPSPPDRPRRHNAANRVHDVAYRTPTRAAALPAIAILADDVARLRALGRSRACLWHCHGLVRRPDSGGGAWMTAGWHAPASADLRRYALGDHLAPSGRDLIGVGSFYHQLVHKVADA